MTVSFMRVLIKNLHTPGRHCASTGLRNLTAFHGLGWSEAFCFGIGAGLGIWYIKSNNPPRMIHVRSADIEERFFLHIGMPVTWETYETQQQSHRELIKKLDAGLPAIVQTDLYYLPYYKSSTHFPGHVITVWGYDDDKKVFYITDTERPALIEVAYSDLAQARFCEDNFFKIHGNCIAPAMMKAPVNMQDTIRNAIIYNSRVILDTSISTQGIQGLTTFYNELELWTQFEDWKWAFRFAYQVIERRGTGGGGFRLIYADFLKEATAYLPDIESLQLPYYMQQTAAAWTAFAMALKEASEKEKPEISPVTTCLENVIQAETRYHTKALMLL